MKASLKSMLAALPVLLALALPGAWVHAQATPTQPAVLTNAIVNNPIQFDVSPPLRTMQPAALPLDAVDEVRPILRPKQNLSGGSQPAASGASPTSLGDPPVRATIGKNFDGVSNLDCAARLDLWECEHPSTLNLGLSWQLGKGPQRRGPFLRWYMRCPST
jgi:hypothetical protein